MVEDSPPYLFGRVLCLNKACGRQKCLKCGILLASNPFLSRFLSCLAGGLVW